MKIYVSFLEWKINSLKHLYKIVKEESPYDFFTIFSIRDEIEENEKELRKARARMFYMKKFDERNR